MYGRIVSNFYTDVYVMRIVHRFLMNMAVDVESTVSQTVETKRNMRAGKTVFVKPFPKIRFCKICLKSGIPNSVVITDNQPFAAFQSAHQSAELSMILKSNVSQMVDVITILNDRIPFLDHVFVHLVQRLERRTNTMTFIVHKLKNICVEEMGVGNEEEIAGHELSKVPGLPPGCSGLSPP
jgi:hypothetical protein